MFRIQSFRMYDIIGSAIAAAAISVALLKRFRVKDLSGEIIALPGKRLDYGIRCAVGGVIFGIGWALTGACPGPLFALISNGISVLIVTVLSALLGTWCMACCDPDFRIHTATCVEPRQF
jgi:uncharacterized membrane protein YedE/YeeE